jgi:hypothetical protein
MYVFEVLVDVAPLGACEMGWDRRERVKDF